MDNSLPDVQSMLPKFNIKLNRVGVENLKIPIFVSQQIGGYQHTVANVSCYVDLEADKKGINMSRLPAAIMKYLDQPLNRQLMESITNNIKSISQAQECELIYSFPYFIKKLSPVQKEPGIVHYNASFICILNGNFRFKFKVEVPTTSLCPCSKEISTNGGAHNQKCIISIDITPKQDKFIWIEDIIRIAEQSASCEIYSVLKRPDEKYVTDYAYDNPRFVEDIARETYDHLTKRDDIEYFKIRVESEESIHVHTAVAEIESVKEFI